MIPVALSEAEKLAAAKEMEEMIASQSTTVGAEAALCPLKEGLETSSETTISDCPEMTHSGEEIASNVPHNSCFAHHTESIANFQNIYINKQNVVMKRFAR